MATDISMSSVKWWALTRGDIDATVAQSGLNLAQILIPVFLLVPAGVPHPCSSDRRCS